MEKDHKKKKSNRRVRLLSFPPRSVTEMWKTRFSPIDYPPFNYVPHSPPTRSYRCHHHQQPHPHPYFYCWLYPQWLLLSLLSQYCPNSPPSHDLNPPGSFSLVHQSGPSHGRHPLFFFPLRSLYGFASVSWYRLPFAHSASSHPGLAHSDLRPRVLACSYWFFVVHLDFCYGSSLGFRLYGPSHDHQGLQCARKGSCRVSWPCQTGYGQRLRDHEYHRHWRMRVP